MEVLFHKPKCKGVADNEIMFAHLWQVACEVASCFYITESGEIPCRQRTCEQVYNQVLPAGFPGLAL